MFYRRRTYSNEQKVMQVISEELGLAVWRFFPDTDIIDGLGADRDDMIAIMIATEYKFHIKISEDNWEKMRTARDITHLVNVYLEIKQIEL